MAGFDRSWSINVRAHFMAARFVMPMMKAAGRSVILNTSSSSGVLYDREMIAYTTTKHAVIAMTRQMAGDFASHGVRVNALCPGWVDTPFNEPFIAQMGGRGGCIVCSARMDLSPIRRRKTTAGPGGYDIRLAVQCQKVRIKLRPAVAEDAP